MQALGFDGHTPGMARRHQVSRAVHTGTKCKHLKMKAMRMGMIYLCVNVGCDAQGSAQRLCPGCPQRVNQGVPKQLFQGARAPMQGVLA